MIQCLGYATLNREYGIWGGTIHKERKAIAFENKLTVQQAKKIANSALAEYAFNQLASRVLHRQGKWLGPMLRKKPATTHSASTS